MKITLMALYESLLPKHNNEEALLIILHCFPRFKSHTC